MSTQPIVRPLSGVIARHPRLLREHEVLRVSASLLGNETYKASEIAIGEVLRWAQNKAISAFSANAWTGHSFEHFASGRSCAAVRLESEDRKIWALRIEDPDKEIPGRTWTTEIVIQSESEHESPHLTLRLLVGTPESQLEIEPHVPGLIRQLIKTPGLISGANRLTDKPLTIRSVSQTQLLIDALLDPVRKIPIIVLSVPSSAVDPFRPLLDAKVLAAACAGLAIVVILPSEFSWNLTERFGKQLSVYEGAARVYLPGFTEDANPFGGHELILPARFVNPVGALTSLTRLRWIAANGSVRRLQLGKDVLAFAALKALSLQQKQIELQDIGATDREQLEAARVRLTFLQDQLKEAEKYQQQFSDLHDAAEDRAETAETQLRAAAFRIQQLVEQLKVSGLTPDAKIELPTAWEDFGNWCDVHLAGRVILTPQARHSIRSPEFEDMNLAARCLLWLGNEYRIAKLGEPDGSLRDRIIEGGVINAHCGADTFEMEWQGEKHEVDWHIKSGGNTRDPQRCLRIYYFWDEASQQAVIASMPEHRRTNAS